MYDSSQQKTDVPQAGHLGVYKQFTFAMYTPKGNIPWAGMFISDTLTCRMRDSS